MEAFTSFKCRNCSRQYDHDTPILHSQARPCIDCGEPEMLIASRPVYVHLAEYRPPCCPECRSAMNYILGDMSGQGGPPAHTWLCPCGRALGTYHPHTKGIVLSAENPHGFPKRPPAGPFG